MASPSPTELVYHSGESVGMALIALCGMLSLASVLSMSAILGMSAVPSSHSSDESPFARTHIGRYFLSLLMCNLVQGIGAVLNFPWMVEGRVYVGRTCAAQATINRIGGVGTAIFTFVIATHTFSLLFLRRRQWSNRTSYTVLIVSLGVLLLDIYIGHFVLKTHYGISDYWCWITPSNPSGKYTTECFFILTSAGLSFILYLLVFFRLRGNITIRAGYKVYFHRRPKVRVGRTNDGAYIVTDDRRVESHLSAVGKQMLWCPVAYTVLVLPFTITQCLSFSGVSVPFPVTIVTASLFMLGGFVNVVMLCTTRNVLPERWKQIFSIGTTSDIGRGDASFHSRMNSKRWRESGARSEAVGTGMASVVLNITVENDIEIQYDRSDRRYSSLRFSPPISPSSPTFPLRAHGGRQRADSESYHIRHQSVSLLRNERPGTWSTGAIDGDDEDSDFSAGMRRARKVKRIIEEVPDQMDRASVEHESATDEPAPGLAASPSLHSFDAVAPANPDPRRPRPPSMVTFETALYRTGTRLSWASVDSRANGSGVHWTGHKAPLSRQRGRYSPALDQHPYAVPYGGTESKRPSGYGSATTNGTS